MLVGYGFVAAVLPVWLLLAPRDYLSTFLKIGTIVGLAIGILIMRPTLTMPALTKFVDGTRPGLDRQPVPVPVYHHRLRRGVRLPRADLLRHHAENAGE
jgi:carbon starvation protein